MQADDANKILTFLSKSHDEQREFLDRRETEDEAKKTIKSIFSIISAIASDPEFTMWALALINGMIEDDRSRIRLLADLQKSRVQSKQCDCINILMSVYMRNVDDKNRMIRDLAAHTLAQLISYRGYENHKEAAEQFLTQLLDAKDKPQKLSRQTYTHCFLYLLKLNELTAVFIRHNGFDALKKLLTSDCQRDSQIAYNVCCCFWILSYHKDAMPHFQDF